MREQVLAELLDELAGSDTFEEAASACLGTLLDVARWHLAASQHRDEGKLLRAIAHWRPGDGYRGVLVRDAEAEQAATAEGDEFLISTAAWQTIAEHGCPAAFDVETQRLTPQHGNGPASRARSRRPAAGPHTISRLQRRGATHLFVMPLRGPGGQPLGMLSVEAECASAIGQRFIWQEASTELQLVCDIAAPYLAQLPPRRGGAADTDEFLPVVGPSMAPLLRLLRVFARQEETLLLSGPTGTGKSRLARWCHERSPRAGGPFEVVDLLSIPDEMQMGEMFGWHKGAFTGATSDHAGSVTRAERGTLFIDEIDKLSARAQAGLLYLLDDRRYRVLGGGPERESNVRFIVGTNADLREQVEQGHFREDLYYRINVLAVALPPLDQRRDEIAAWARYMLERRHGEMGEPGKVTLAPGGAELLSTSSWPGGLRQLDNVVRRAYVLALADRTDAMGSVEVGESQLRLSMSSEGGSALAGTPDPLRAAARFVTEAARKNGRFDLDLLAGIRGLALIEAIRETGSKEAAFRLLGRESLVESRNHHKALQRELERAAELCRALGIEIDPNIDRKGDPQ